MQFFGIAATIASLTVLVAAAPKHFLEKRAIGPATDDTDFIKAVLSTHNAHRQNRVDVPDLTWDDTLAQFAQGAVNKCDFDHSGGPYGENLFGIWPGYGDWTAGTVDAVGSWISEANSYNYSSPGFNMNTGHFTQAVWKGTTSVGCSWNTIDCAGAAFLYCEYSPAGNMDGAYEQNVLRANR